MSGKANSYMPCFAFLASLCVADWGISYKTNPSVVKFDNHFLANLYFLLGQKTRGQRPLVNYFITRSFFILPSCQNRHRTHHSVIFYFTVLSEPSQDSSLMKKNFPFLLLLYSILVIFTRPIYICLFTSKRQHWIFLCRLFRRNQSTNQCQHNTENNQNNCTVCWKYRIDSGVSC